MSDQVRAQSGPAIKPTWLSSWDRMCSDDDPESLGVLAGLMAAAFTWVSEQQVERILGWYEREGPGRGSRAWTPFRLRAVLRLTWFLERRGEGPGGAKGAFYQSRHQSVRDFLLSPDGPVPVSGLLEMHAAVGDYYCAEAGKQGGWPRLDPYGRYFAVRHLHAAEDRENLARAVGLLTSLDYLRGALGETPPKAVDA